MGARGGSRTLGVVVFFLCLLWCFHSPMVPFSTCGSQYPIPIRHSPALGCSQQAPATVWIPKSPGGDPKLSLVSTSRVRAPGQGVHRLRATPAVPWGSLGWIWICSCSDHEEQPSCQEVVNPKNRVGLGITESSDGPTASPTARAQHAGTEGLCQLLSMVPLGFCPPRHTNPPCLQLHH